jgi:hypothetical protein
MKTLIQATTLEEAAAKLKAAYRTLYEEILKLDSSCFDLKEGSNFLPMEDVLSRISVDTSKLPNIGEYINTNYLNAGLLLHDLSGVGLYTLAYYLANAWAEPDTKKAILKKYQIVIVLPIEQVHLYTPQDPNNLTIKDLFRFWNIDIGTLNPDTNNILIIASGCSERLRIDPAPNESEEAKIVREKRIEQLRSFVEFIQTFHHIIIDNTDKPSYLVKSLKVIDLCLTPFYFRVDHLKGKPEKDVVESSTFYIPGKLIIKEAKTVTEQTFFEHRGGKLEGSVWTTEEWHEQVKRFMKEANPHIKHSQIKVEHIYHILNLQGFIRSILNPNIAATEFSPRPLNSPATWFGASITAEVKDENKQLYASYRIGKYFLARNLGNNYIANLGDIKSMLKLQKKTPNINNENLRDLLASLVTRNDFDNMNEVDIVDAIKSFEFKETVGQAFKAKSVFHEFIKAIDKFIPERFH